MISLGKNTGITFGSGSGSGSEIDNIRIETTQDAPWPIAPQKDVETVEITKVSESLSGNTASYRVTSLDDTVGVVAIKAVYKPDGGIESESEPLMLAFGCNAELTWENAAPDYPWPAEKCKHLNELNKCWDRHVAHDEVLLQRHADGVISNTDLFMDEHAQVTLKLTSLLNNKPLAAIPVKWQLMGDQPPNMAVFLHKITDDEGSNWDAAGQTVYSWTPTNGQIELPVSARQLYKVVDPRPRNRAGTGESLSWRSFTPAAGEATVEADIQGQRKQIKVPFVDSLWLQMEYRHFGEVTSPSSAQGYVVTYAYMRPGKPESKKPVASRPFVFAFLDDSTELEELRFSVQPTESVQPAPAAISHDVTLPRDTNIPGRPYFRCMESQTCKAMHRDLGNNYKGPVCFRYLASPTAASVKFLPDDSCDSSVCIPLTPAQPASNDGQTEDGIFCVPQWNLEPSLQIDKNTPKLRHNKA